MPPNISETVQSVRISHQEYLAKSKTWAATFPEQFDTVSDSSKFMERCLLLSMSQLLYSRALLPADAFKKRNVTDIVRCQIPNMQNGIGSRLMEKLKGAGEALRRGYLKEFIVVVSTDDQNHDDAVEVFAWAMRYKDDLISPSYAVLTNDSRETLMKLEYLGPEYVKDQTRLLLSRIRKLCTDILKPLPKSAFPTFRITYSTNVPQGYQAPGFYRSQTLYELHPDARSVDISAIATGKHAFILSVDSVFIHNEDAARNAIKNGDNASDESTANSDTSFFDHVPAPYDSVETPRVRFSTDDGQTNEVAPPPTEALPEKESYTASQEKRSANRKRDRPVKPQEEISPNAPTQKRTRRQLATNVPSKSPDVLQKAAAQSKRTPGYSGKMTEKTPTTSPPRNR